MISTNHIATNIITKGFINSFALTNGILTNLKYEIITPTKKHGGTSYGKLKEDIKEIGIEDIDTIKVYVNWYKNINVKNINITAELLKNKIYAELIEEYGEKSKKIKVEILK